MGSIRRLRLENTALKSGTPAQSFPTRTGLITLQEMHTLASCAGRSGEKERFTCVLSVLICLIVSPISLHFVTHTCLSLND